MIDKEKNITSASYSAFDNKIQGLRQLKDKGFPVPEFMIIDQSEQHYYMANGDLSNGYKLKAV